MTISSTTVKNSYSGDGSTTSFNYTFKIFADSDLQVIIRSAAGTETVKTITTHYIVSGAGNTNGVQSQIVIPFARLKPFHLLPKPLVPNAKMNSVQNATKIGLNILQSVQSI